MNFKISEQDKENLIIGQLIDVMLENNMSYVGYVKNKHDDYLTLDSLCGKDVSLYYKDIKIISNLRKKDIKGITVCIDDTVDVTSLMLPRHIGIVDNISTAMISIGDQILDIDTIKEINIVNR